MLRGSFTWVRVVTPAAVGFKVLLGEPNCGELVTLNASAQLQPLVEREGFEQRHIDRRHLRRAEAGEPQTQSRQFRPWLKRLSNRTCSELYQLCPPGYGFR